MNNIHEKTITTVSDLLVKGGVGAIILLLLAGVLYMAHEERIEEESQKVELIKMLLQQCFNIKQNTQGMSFDHIFELQGLAEIDREIEHVEGLIEDAASD